MKKILRIGTRKSLLATTQSGHVRDSIQERYPDLAIEMLFITTTGDRIQDVPLAKVGGKGLFVKEIEEALLDGRIDIAVHSMKDVPAELPPGLELGIIPCREDARDAFLSKRWPSLAALPAGARVGTSSLRRQSQIAVHRPDLLIETLRGNLDTRLRKLDEGRYDAIILAAAGLNRLGLAARITAAIDPAAMLPAVGQGALGIEMRTEDQDLRAALLFLEDEKTRQAVTAERAFLHRLEGGCQVPIGGHAVSDGDTVRMTGLVAAVDGGRAIRMEMDGPAPDAAGIGRSLAEKILAAGGDAILREVYDSCRQSQS